MKFVKRPPSKKWWSGQIPRLDKRLWVSAFLSAALLVSISLLVHVADLRHQAKMERLGKEYDGIRRDVKLTYWCLKELKPKQSERGEKESVKYRDRCLDGWIKQKEYDEKIRKRINKMLRGYNSPLLNTDFVETAITVERAGGNSGHAFFSTSTSGAESTFGKRYPRGSRNVWGLGGCAGCVLPSYDSWLEGQIALSVFIGKRYGRGAITINDLHAINKFYASSKVWHRSVRYFWEGI